MALGLAALIRSCSMQAVHGTDGILQLNVSKNVHSIACPKLAVSPWMWSCQQPA